MSLEEDPTQYRTATEPDAGSASLELKGVIGYNGMHLFLPSFLSFLI